MRAACEGCRAAEATRFCVEEGEGTTGRGARKGRCEWGWWRRGGRRAVGIRKPRDVPGRGGMRKTKLEAEMESCERKEMQVTSKRIADIVSERKTCSCAGCATSKGKTRIRCVKPSSDAKYSPLGTSRRGFVIGGKNGSNGELSKHGSDLALRRTQTIQTAPVLGRTSKRKGTKMSHEL